MALAEGSEFGGQAPSPGAPLPHGTFGVCGLSHSRREVGARASRPPPSHRPAAAPQYEVVLASPGRGAAAAAAAAGGSLRESPGVARRPRFSPARPGLEAFLQPRGRGSDTKTLCGQ